MQVVITNAFSPDKLKALRASAHPHCIVCGPQHLLGLRMEFAPSKSGGVEGTFSGGTMFQGYDSIIHGGVIAALLDGAMTHCLFALGRQAVTAELKIRYRRPVATNEAMTVRAWREKSGSSLHLLRAELVQQGCVKAVATAKFMERT